MGESDEPGPFRSAVIENAGCRLRGSGIVRIKKIPVIAGIFYLQVIPTLAGNVDRTGQPPAGQRKPDPAWRRPACCG